MKPFLPLCILLLTACESPSDKILKDFKTVNDKIKEANAAVDRKTSLSLLYFDIRSRRNKNPQLAVKADSLYAATTAAIRYMEQLRQRLTAVDSAGEKRGPAEQLLLHTAASDSVLAHLSNVSRYAYEGLAGKEKRNSIDTVLNDIHNAAGMKDWTGYFFKQAYTAEALTILSKFQSDCTKAALITLEDINQHL